MQPTRPPRRRPVFFLDASDRKRVLGIASFLCLLFGVLIVRFYKIQILEHEQWVKQAALQHQYVSPIPCMRGSFYSNTSIKRGHPEEEQPFVIDVPKFHLFVDPKAISASFRYELVQGLASFLAGNQAEVQQKILGELEKPSRSRKIAAWLDREKRQEIEKWWAPFAMARKIPSNALFFSSEFQRSYPFGSMLGAVLHTVQAEKDPKTLQRVPTGGLEMLFNNYLEGKMGKKLITRSARRMIDSGKILEPAENGADIYLTINHYLQAIVERHLQEGVAAAGAKGGWAVMMDPHTGEILALAQTPCLDPSRYADFFNDPSLQDATRVRAVLDCYEPGSIFKPITMAVCLKANEELQRRGQAPLFSPTEKIATSNGWFVGRSSPIKDGRLHHFLNMEMAMQKSSNIYMGRVVHRLIETLGEEWYRRALEEVFGFGQKTQVELPAESSGLLPTPGKLHPNGKLEWSLPTPYSLAIGHNILINGLQLVRAYAILANGGKAVQPHLVRKIVKNGEILADFSDYRANEQVLSASICETIIRSMKFVTKEGGNSKRADIPGYTEAGKSGTAEKIIDGHYSKDHNISSFLGIAPAKNPRFVLLVSIDDPEKKLIPGVGGQQFGGICAAPVFRDIAVLSLQYLGVDPDDPYGYPVGDPRRNGEKADFVKEVQALKELYETWNVAR